MSFSLILPESSSSVFGPVNIFLFLCSLIPITLASTWLSTTIKFHRAKSLANSKPKSSFKPIPPPIIPYSIPRLGSTLAFLDESHGRFWTNLRQRLGPNLEICTILLGGIRTHVLAAGVEGLFKASKVTDRQRFNHDVMTKGFGMSLEETDKFYATANEVGKQKMTTQDALYHEFLLSPAAVNTLTSKFLETFRQAIDQDGDQNDWITVDLCSWFKDKMFIASTTAFMGSKIFELCPQIAQDFWILDANILKLLYGIPKMFTREGHDALKRVLDAGEKWHEQAFKNTDLEGTKDLEWEPWFGSRFIRARQVMYKRAGLSNRGTVSPDIGFLFGLSSNAIPASSWMLLHILLSPNPNLLPSLLAEVQSARLHIDAGELDIPRLISLPILQSLYMETLRLYVDVLVTREVRSTFVLPPNHLLKKGDVVMAPSYLSHHDPVFWSAYSSTSSSLPPSDFDPHRFLSSHSDFEKPTFSTAGTGGKLFPYGGGSHMCPGRVFAKQEILAAVATMLLEFEFEVAEGSRMPGFRKAYAGIGVVGMEGDVRVRMRRRRR